MRLTQLTIVRIVYIVWCILILICLCFADLGIVSDLGLTGEVSVPPFDVCNFILINSFMASI